LSQLRKLRYKILKVRKCKQCGERLRRVHRTFQERIKYLAVYRCPGCQATETAERRYRLHLGESCRCPKCGTYRVTKLKERDHIDKMHTGFLHLLERLSGGRLYHCCFCRLQFYDRRTMRARTSASAPVPVEAPGEVRSDSAPPSETVESQTTANPAA
jgi:hypothetical protein